VTYRGYNPAATPLRALREARGLSLRDLEATTGINRAIWSQVERGRMVAEPRQVAALALALDVPIEAFRYRIVLEAEGIA
jgi:transcriptional regulator with XRE-family HTH domain